MNISVILGYIANESIEEAGLKLPLFVPCLIVAISVVQYRPGPFSAHSMAGPFQGARCDVRLLPVAVSWPCR